VAPCDSGALAALAGSDMNWLVCNQMGLGHAGPAPLSIMDGLEINWYPEGTEGTEHGKAESAAPAPIPMPTRPPSNEAVAEAPAEGAMEAPNSKSGRSSYMMGESS
jgi:hypothetical protein